MLQSRRARPEKRQAGLKDARRVTVQPNLDEGENTTSSQQDGKVGELKVVRKKSSLKKSSLDLTSLIGLVLGPACILFGQYCEGGRVSSLIQKNAALIVLGGTIGSCMVSFSYSYLAAAVRDLSKVVSERTPDPYELIDRIVNYSLILRKEGPVPLQRHVRTEPYPMLAKGVALIVANITPEALASILERAFHEKARLANAGAEVFEAAGGYLPTFGILGAVLGLIHTMATLTDPSKVGLGISTAFVATVYGVGMANLVAFPVARKIRARAVSEKQLDKIVLTGLTNMRAGMAGAALRQLLTGGGNPPPNGPVQLAPETQARESA